MAPPAAGAAASRRSILPGCSCHSVLACTVCTSPRLRGLLDTVRPRRDETCLGEEAVSCMAFVCLPQTVGKADRHCLQALAATARRGVASIQSELARAKTRAKIPHERHRPTHN